MFCKASASLDSVFIVFLFAFCLQVQKGSFPGLEVVVLIEHHLVDFHSFPENSL